MNFRHLQKLSVCCNYNTLYRAARYSSPAHKPISTIPGPAESDSSYVTKCSQPRTLTMSQTSGPCFYIRKISHANSIRHPSRPATEKLSTRTRNASKLTLNSKGSGKISRGFKIKAEKLFGRSETKKIDRANFTTFSGRRTPTKRTKGNKYTDQVKLKKIITEILRTSQQNCEHIRDTNKIADNHQKATLYDPLKMLLTVDEPSNQQRRCYSSKRSRTPIDSSKKRSRSPSVSVNKSKSRAFPPRKKILGPVKDPEEPLVVSKVYPESPCMNEPQGLSYFYRRIEAKNNDGVKYKTKKVYFNYPDKISNVKNVSEMSKASSNNAAPVPQQVKEDISINKNRSKPPKTTFYNDGMHVEHIKEVVTKSVTKISEEEYLAAVSSPPQVQQEGEYYQKLFSNKENSNEVSLKNIRTDASNENNITIEYIKRISRTLKNKSNNRNLRLPEKSVKIAAKKDIGTETSTSIYQLKGQEEKSAVKLTPKEKKKHEKIIVVKPPKNEEMKTEIPTETSSSAEIYYDAIDSENDLNELETKFKLEHTLFNEELEKKIKAADKEDNLQQFETKQDSKINIHPWEMTSSELRSKLYNKQNSQSKILDRVNDSISNIEELEVKTIKNIDNNKQNLGFPEETKETTTNNNYKPEFYEYKPKVNTKMTNSLHFDEFYPWKSYEKDQKFANTHNAVTAKSVKLHFEDCYPWKSNKKNQESSNKQNTDTAKTKEKYDNTNKKYKAMEICKKNYSNNILPIDNSSKTEMKELIQFSGKTIETEKKPLGILHVTINISRMNTPMLEPLFFKPEAIMCRMLRFEEYKKQFLALESKKPLESKPKKSIGTLTVLLNPLKKPQTIQEDFNELSKIEKICKEELLALHSNQILNNDTTLENPLKLSHEDRKKANFSKYVEESQSNQNINKALLEDNSKQNPVNLFSNKPEEFSAKNSNNPKNVQTTVDIDWSQIKLEAKKTLEEIEKSNTFDVNNKNRMFVDAQTKQLNSITNLQSKAVKHLEENYKHSTKDQLEIKKSDISSMVEEKMCNTKSKPRVTTTVIIQSRKKSSQSLTAHKLISNRSQERTTTNFDDLSVQKSASFSTCDKDKCAKYERTKDDPFGRKKPDPYRHKQKKMCPRPKPIDLRTNMKASDCKKCTGSKDEGPSCCKKPDPCIDTCKEKSTPSCCPKKKSKCEEDPCNKKSTCQPDPCKKKSICDRSPCKKKSTSSCSKPKKFNPCKGSGAPKKSCSSNKKSNPCKKKSKSSCKQDPCKKKPESPCAKSKKSSPCKGAPKKTAVKKGIKHCSSKKSQSSCKPQKKQSTCDPCEKFKKQDKKKSICSKSSSSSCKKNKKPSPCSPCEKKSTCSPCKKTSSRCIKTPSSRCKKTPSSCCKKTPSSRCKKTPSSPCKKKSSCRTCKKKSSNPCKKKAASPCKRKPSKCSRKSSLKDKFMQMCKGPNTKNKIQKEPENPCTLPKNKAKAMQEKNPCKKSKEASPCSKTRKASPCRKAKEESPCKMKKSKEKVVKKKNSAKVLPKPVCGKPENKETKPTEPKKGTKPDCCKKSTSGCSSGSKMCSCNSSASKISCQGSNRPSFAAYKEGAKNVCSLCCSRHTKAWLSNEVPCKTSSSLSLSERKSRKVKLPSPKCTSAPGTFNLCCRGKRTKDKSNQPISVLPGCPPICGEIIINRQIELEECDPKTGQKIVKKVQKKITGAAVLPPPSNCGKIPEIKASPSKKKINCKIDVTKKLDRKASTSSTNKKSFSTKSSPKSVCNCETTSFHKYETKTKTCSKCETKTQTVCKCETKSKPVSESHFKSDCKCEHEECSFKCIPTEMSSSELSSRSCRPTTIPQIISPCPPQPKTQTPDSPPCMGRSRKCKSNPNLYTREDVRRCETPYRPPSIYKVHNIQYRILGPKSVKDSFSKICRMKPGHKKCTENDCQKIVCNDCKKCNDPAKIEVNPKYIEQVEEMIETKQCLSHYAMKHIPCVSPKVKQKKPRYLEILKRLQSKPATPEAYDPCKKRSGTITKNTCCNPKLKSSVCDH